MEQTINNGFEDTARILKDRTSAIAITTLNELDSDRNAAATQEVLISGNNERTALFKLLRDKYPDGRSLSLDELGWVAAEAKSRCDSTKKRETETPLPIRSPEQREFVSDDHITKVAMMNVVLNYLNGTKLNKSQKLLWRELLRLFVRVLNKR